MTALDARPQWTQRTPEWYAKRKELLTASDAAAALNIPPYERYRGSPREHLLEKKVADIPITGYNPAISHGVKHEDEVREALCALLGEPVKEHGLFVHQKYPWLGASPDGVSASGKMVEIKCPLRRQITPGHVPEHYYPQVQLQLEVCDLDVALFVQFKPGEPLDVTVVERDRLWFARNVDALHAFFQDYVRAKKAYVPPPPPVCLVDPDLYSAL